jgi:hypothetical protein|tara:strand:- start:413 stop:877 length:465 start_codon:yes stop_codon:yes gene_type:complete
MANTTFSGPILAGTIKNTTGTTAGTDIKNTGQVLMSQSFSFTYATEGSATDTTVVIPANSQIVSVDVNVETAFNDTGADILEVGSSADTDLYVNDTDISAAGSIAMGTAALCANWKDIGSTDIVVGYIYNGANNDATAGAATVTINYLQNNNLS